MCNKKITDKLQKGVFIVALDKFALAIVVIGAINWGLIGLLQFDLVAWLCGGAGTLLARLIYAVVGIAGVWAITILIKNIEHQPS